MVSGEGREGTAGQEVLEGEQGGEGKFKRMPQQCSLPARIGGAGSVAGQAMVPDLAAGSTACACAALRPTCRSMHNGARLTCRSSGSTTCIEQRRVGAWKGCRVLAAVVDECKWSHSGYSRCTLMQSRSC